MANMSPVGAFAEGIAGGISGGVENYIRGMNQRIDKQEKQDIFKMNQAFKFFTDENLPVTIRKQAYKVWQDLNKGWKTGIEPLDFPDEYWQGKKLTPFFKKGLAIMKNDDYTDKEKVTFLRGLDVEIADYLGIAPKEQLENIQKNIQGEQAAGLLAPRGGQPSPVMKGLKGAYGAESAGAMGAMVGSGIPGTSFKDVTSMFPQKKAASEPTTPMHITIEAEGGTQKMRWNPKTREHDIPIGKKKVAEAKAGHFFKLSGNYYETKDGKAMLIKQGSLRERATMNAMREFGWSMMAEPDQIKLVDRHERLLAGRPAGDDRDGDKERTDAAAAIAAGVDPKLVKAMYKKRTGKEY